MLSQPATEFNSPRFGDIRRGIGRITYGSVLQPQSAYVYGDSLDINSEAGKYMVTATPPRVSPHEGLWYLDRD